MASVDTQNEIPRSVTQAVYTVAFENLEESRQIAELQAEKRRAEEAEREAALRKQSAEAASANTPSVVVDVKSADVSPAAEPETSSVPSAVPGNAVNVLA